MNNKICYIYYIYIYILVYYERTGKKSGNCLELRNKLEDCHCKKAINTQNIFKFEVSPLPFSNLLSTSP
jgi:hypothetical protein